MVKSKKHMARVRATLVFGIVMLIFLVAVGFLFRWQIVRGEELRSKAMAQSLQTTSLSSNRGTIYDATGTKILAQSASVWMITLEPAYIKSDAHREKLADGLSQILDMDRETVLAKTNEKSYFTYLKRKVETEVKDKVLAFLDKNDIDRGVRVVEDYKRYYPYGDMASVVLGFTGTDGNGLLGVENEYETELSGTKGRMVSAKNAIGTDMPFQYEQMISAENGHDLVLTIDETVQSIVEKYLEEGVVKNGVKNGAAAVVMDVNTGAIIALATGDKFDLNDPFTIANEKVVKEIELLPEAEQDEAFNNALYKQWRNKAVSDTYYPGSVFKMATASMALENGDINASTTFGCSGSYFPDPSVEINCWYGPSRGGHGTQTVRQGLCNSCNPFFMQTAERMGAANFFKYFEAFGFTETTGIDLPGEASSIYYSLNKLNPVELATESFGQNFSITPIQMITAASAIANGGYIVQPHVVDRILDSEGNIVKSADTTYKRQVISKETSDLVTDILKENATSGSGKSGYVAGYRICGKTGTSEKMDKWAQDKSKPKEYIASYCGYAPADNPQYALLVYLDEPDRETASGGVMAGPIFSAIMKEILPYLGVESQLTAEEFSEDYTNAPSVMGKTLGEAKKIIEDSGLDCEIYGSSENEDAIVRMQIPSAGAEMPKSGKVIISQADTVSDADYVTVPDFTDMSSGECEDAAANAGIQAIITGSATDGDLKARNQNIVAGEKVKPGTVITITVVDSSGME